MGQKRKPAGLFTVYESNFKKVLGMVLWDTMTDEDFEWAKKSAIDNLRWLQEAYALEGRLGHLAGSRCRFISDVDVVTKGMTHAQIAEFVEKMKEIGDSLEYEHGFFDDLLEAAIRRLNSVRADAGFGVVYVIGFDRWFKIGRTVNMRQRLSGIKLPVEPHIAGEYKVVNCVTVETMLHRHFRDKRANGEWFELMPEDLTTIAQMVEPYLEIEQHKAK